MTINEWLRQDAKMRNKDVVMVLCGIFLMLVLILLT